jgi:hypothetical protein
MRNRTQFFLQRNGTYFLNMARKNTRHAAEPEVVNPRQEEPILSKKSTERGSPISATPYRQDTSVTNHTWLHSDMPITWG